MKFTMIRWYKPIFLLIAIASFYGLKPDITTSRDPKAKGLQVGWSVESNELSVGDQLIARKQSNCQKINANYQVIYDFETENHYISICQLDNNYYYYRASKLDPQSSLLVAAQPVFGGSVFQATDGKTVYFVGQNGDSYYSSVMQNHNEMVFEPELVTPLPTFSQNTINSKPDFPLSNVKLDNFSGTGRNEAQDPICIQEQSASASSLEGWHNLLGQSTIAANDYAIEQGHHFVYNSNNPEQALIKTREGIVVNLGIASHSQTIEKVCLQSTEDI